MGLFDFLGKKNDKPPKASEREIARLERLLANKLSQNFDRQEAIQELGRMGTAASAAALLKRFDWVLDPSITDQDEKEACLKGIVAAGSDAIEPIRQYCKKAESLTWPLKILREIVPEDRLPEELLGILDQFDTEYMRNPEPKIQIIQVLEGHPLEDVRIAVEPFLQDASEPVRFTAVGTILAVNDPQSVPALVDALSGEESRRVQNRIAQGLVDRKWSVEADQRAALGKALPPGFSVTADGTVKGGTAAASFG